MANEIIRPSALETERMSPVASEFLVTDNETSVAKVTIEKAVKAGRPAASKSEAEAGSDANKVMTPLTVQQKIDFEIGKSLASKAQGDKADTAVQPSDLSAVATSNDYDDLDNKPTLGTAAAQDAGAFATAEQGGKADTALQSIVEGSGITVDVTDPNNPVISYTGTDGVSDGDKGDVIVSDSGAKWELARNFKTVPDLLADTTMGYEGSGASVVVGEGDVITAGGLRFVVAAADASDEHEETAGGIRLYEAGPSFTHIDRLRRLPGHEGASATLTQSGRAGVFKWVGADLSSIVTTDTRMGVYSPPLTDPTGTSGAWVRVVDGPLLFDWFGPAKDIVTPTDDTAIWNAAAGLASTLKTTLRVSTGDYSINNGSLYSNMRVQLEPGARFVQPDSVSVVSHHILKGAGALASGSSANLTANAAVGATSVSVSAGGEAAFEAGGWAMLEDDDAVIKRYELIRVLSTASGIINFDRPITESFTTTASSKITPASPVVNCVVEGYGEMIVGLNRAYGILFDIAANCNVKEISVKRPRSGGGVVFDKAYSCHAANASVVDGQSISSSGLGYGFVLSYSCVECSITRCYTRGVRENTATLRARHCLVSGNTFVESYDSGFNTHCTGCHHFTISNNIIRQGEVGTAIAIGYSTGLLPDHNNVVIGNIIEAKRLAVQVSCATGALSYGNKVVGNQITGMNGVANSGAILLTRAVNPIVSGNDIADVTLFNAIYVLECQDAIICRNTLLNVANSTGSGIRLAASCTDTVISHNTMLNVTAAPVLVPTGTSGVRVVQNVAYDSGAVSITAVAANAQNSWN